MYGFENDEFEIEKFKVYILDLFKSKINIIVMEGEFIVILLQLFKVKYEFLKEFWKESVEG